MSGIKNITRILNLDKKFSLILNLDENFLLFNLQLEFYHPQKKKSSIGIRVIMNLWVIEISDSDYFLFKKTCSQKEKDFYLKISCGV